MQRIKFLAATAILVLAIGVFFSSQAQKKMTNHRMPPMPPVPVGLSGTYQSELAASEVNAGEISESATEMYGWTWSGTTKGDLSGYYFMSMNYTFGAGPGDPVDAIGSDVENIVCGGSWTKLIFVNGVYQGSISGTITSGTINWSHKSGLGMVDLKLVADKGTDAYAGYTGTGGFTGTIDRSFGSAAMAGSLTLNY